MINTKDSQTLASILAHLFCYGGSIEQQDRINMLRILTHMEHLLETPGNAQSAHILSEDTGFDCMQSIIDIVTYHRYKATGDTPDTFYNIEVLTLHKRIQTICGKHYSKTINKKK